jgi:peptidoglycan hydrolase CwlO-like protein
MTIIESDYAVIFGQRIERPENMVPGDWLSFWDAAVSPVDYQDAFEEGMESVSGEWEKQVSDLEEEVNDLRSEVRDLENEVENLEMEIERLGGSVE